jgi:hypothetical protein
LSIQANDSSGVISGCAIYETDGSNFYRAMWVCDKDIAGDKTVRLLFRAPEIIPSGTYTNRITAITQGTGSAFYQVESAALASSGETDPDPALTEDCAEQELAWTASDKFEGADDTMASTAPTAGQLVIVDVTMDKNASWTVTDDVYFWFELLWK